MRRLRLRSEVDGDDDDDGDGDGDDDECDKGNSAGKERFLLSQLNAVSFLDEKCSRT